MEDLLKLAAAFAVVVLSVTANPALASHRKPQASIPMAAPEYSQAAIEAAAESDARGWFLLYVIVLSPVLVGMGVALHRSDKREKALKAELEKQARRFRDIQD